MTISTIQSKTQPIRLHLMSQGQFQINPLRLMVAMVLNPKKPTASALKTTKRQWAAANRQKGSTKEDVDLAMIQIAEKTLARAIRKDAIS